MAAALDTHAKRSGCASVCAWNGLGAPARACPSVQDGADAELCDLFGGCGVCRGVVDLDVGSECCSQATVVNASSKNLISDAGGMLQMEATL